MPSLLLLVCSWLVLAASATAQADACPCWDLEVPSDGSAPTARHEAAYVDIGGQFHLMGGRGGRPVDRYDPIAQTWTELGFPPKSMHHYQPVVVDGLVWVLCAFEGPYPNETPVADIWTYDAASDDWASGSAIPAARNRGSAGAVAFDGKIYVVGGNTLGHSGGAVPWFDCYDPQTDTWTTLPDAPHARDHFTAALVGNKLVAAGGRTTEQPNPFLNTVAPVDVYDFSTGTWTSAPEPIPTPRAGTMTVARGEHVIVVGGETSGGAHAETEALDVGTGEWVALPMLLDSRHSGGAVLHDDVVYVASGSGNKGGMPELTTQERLDLAGRLPPSVSNLLTNADLDDGLIGWDDQGDLSLQPLGNIAAPSLDIENGWAGQTVAADAEATYALQLVAEVTGTTGGASIALEALDGTASVVGSVSVVLAPTSAFTTVAAELTTPVGATSLRVRCEASGDHVLRVDDLVLVEKRAEIPRLGVPANPWVLSSSTNGPVLGAVFDPSIDHTTFMPGATTDALLVGLAPLNLVVGQGTLVVDLSLSFLFLGPPGDPFLLPIPVDPTIIGLAFHVQGASTQPGVKRLTNGYEVTFQAP